MEKQKKQKKQKKQSSSKKTISQKISGINTTSNISYGNVDVNPKDKRVKWLFGLAIIILLGVGVGVPLAFAGVEYVKRQPYDPNLEVVPGGPTLGDMVEGNKDKEEIQKNTEKIENIIVEKLYNEEREAFLKFEAFVNNTKYKGTSDKVGPTTFGVDVSQSFEDIRKSQENELNIAKKAMRESYPLDWAEKWNTELQSDKYGNSSTDEEAIDFLTKNIAKDAAFARFNTAEINTTSWTQADLSLQAKQNIVYTNDNGEEQIIPAGTKLFVDNFLSPEGDNIAIPSNRNPITPSSEVKIAVYETKSYVLTERNPLNRLPNLYNDYFKSANISSVTIPFAQNTENSEFELVVTQDILTNLFTVSRSQDGSLLMPFNTISNFKGANTNSLRKSKDIAIINTLSQTSSDDGSTTTREQATTGSNLGSSKVTSLATLIKSEENESRAFHVAAISAAISPDLENGLFKIKEANPIDIFLEKILSITTITHPGISPRIINFVEFLNNQLNPVINTTPNIEEENISFTFAENFDLYKFNKELKVLINDINVSDFNNTFNKLLVESFHDPDPYANFILPPDTTVEIPDVPKKWTVYKIGNDTYLYVDAKGLTVYNIENLVNLTEPNLNPALVMLKNDIQNTIDIVDNPSKVILYDVVAQYNKIATFEIINKILIEENKDYIIQELDKELDTSADANNSLNILNDVYQNLVNVINNTINPDVQNAMTGLSTFIEELVKPQNSYDFSETSSASGPINIKMMNNSQYTNGTLDGYILIESEFDDKLRGIISVKATSNSTLFPPSNRRSK